MDVGAFVEENKRWLLGCALGVVVFFTARGVIGAVYDPDPVQRKARSAVGSVPNEVYDQKALEAARAERDALLQQKEALVAELGFTIDPVYRLEGHGSPDAYLGSIGRELKFRLLREANMRDIELKDSDLSWPTPTSPDEIRATLFGLELIDAACRRLFAAHDAVRQAQPLARGIARMQLAVEARRPQRSVVRPRQGEVPLGDLLDQQQVTFQFEADASTALAFLESCRQPGKTLVLDSITMREPQRRGDLPQVKGAFSGIAFRQEGN